MKRLLREHGTSRWVAADGTLVEDLDLALEIQNVRQALSFCRNHRLHGMELVLKFPKTEYDLSLPLKDAV